MPATWVMLEHLKPQGWSIRAIARPLGIDRHAVRRALRREGLPPDTRTTRRAAKSAPDTPSLQRRLDACPELTAVRLYQEIQAQGSPGRCSIPRALVRPLRQEHRRLGQRTVRFEPAPGGQGQVAWGHCGRIAHQGRWAPL
jgi:transposase